MARTSYPEPDTSHRLGLGGRFLVHDAERSLRLGCLQLPGLSRPSWRSCRPFGVLARFRCGWFLLRAWFELPCLHSTYWVIPNPESKKSCAPTWTWSERALTPSHRVAPARTISLLLPLAHPAGPCRNPHAAQGDRTETRSIRERTHLQVPRPPAPATRRDEVPPARWVCGRRRALEIDNERERHGRSTGPGEQPNPLRQIITRARPRR